MSGSAWRQFCCCLLVLSAVAVTSAYLPYHSASYGGHKTNDIYNNPVKRYGPSFKSDASIAKYLRIFGAKVMLWRCKNAIQPYWNWKPIELVELYCETLGTIRKVEWFHNGNLIDSSGDNPARHYHELVYAHYAHGHYYSEWLDFKLIITNATSRDTGMYTFRVTGTDDRAEEQIIYVDISEKKRKKKSRKYGRKYGIRWDGSKWERKSKKLKKRANRRRDRIETERS